MSTTIEDVLKKYWGYRSFRPLQEEIIKSVLAGQDTLALLPTGGGKSVCFQVPAMVNEGVCLVISPLIALMSDQVGQLKKRGINAVAVNSSLTNREIDVALDNAVYGDVKFLYVSPERLKTDMFLARLPKMKVALLAVDEAHCISEWGYDFRPAYRDIAEIRPLIPGVPVVALTATATPDVVEDITIRLEMKKPAVFRMSFERKNLIYVVQDEQRKLNRILNITNRLKGSGIVYVNTRRETLRYSEYLRSGGVSSLPYHGGMNNVERSQTQDLWINNKARVIVATNAFGMGIDKPDVRFVVHPALPSSVEAYYQEAGRAGRDGNRSYAVVLTDDRDREELRRKIQDQMPNSKKVRQVYRALTNYFQLAVGSAMTEPMPFDVVEFSKRYHFKTAEALSALKILEYYEYLTLTDAVFSPSRLKILVSVKAVYSFEIGHPKFEPLIRLLLRSYEGLFDQPVRINEYEISRRIRMPAEAIRDKLRYLAQMRMVNYREQTELPFLSFPRGSLHPDSLIFPGDYIKKHALRLETKMESMINYSTNTVVCRSKQLTGYFGDRSATNCGLCDVCLSKKKPLNPEENLREIRQSIIAWLKEKSLSLKELQSDKTYKPIDTLDTLRWMSEHDEIEIDGNNYVKLNTGNTLKTG